jgi:hypothetical protein
MLISILLFKIVQKLFNVKYTLTNKMQNLQTVNKIINFSHETFHEDYFRKADAHIFYFRGESLKTIIIIMY